MSLLMNILPEMPSGKGDNVINLTDTREKDAVTGKKLSDNNRMSTSVRKELLNDIINKAVQNGIDPYTALAMAHQESSFGNEQGLESNPFHLSLTNDGEISLKDLSEKGPVQVFMDKFKQKQALAKKLGKTDEASVIQAWNGYGKLGGKEYYGIDATQTPIDMDKNPVYGKRVLDIRDNIIKKNPQIVEMVNNATNQRKPFDYSIPGSILQPLMFTNGR